MCGDIESKKFFRRFFYLLNAWIAEFENFVAILANQMIVLFVSICAFELRLVAAELVFGNESAFEQKLNRIVQSSAADTVLFIFHKDVQGFNIKMPALRINFIEYRESFGRFAVPLLSEMFGENILNGFPDVGIGHWKFKKTCKST